MGKADSDDSKLIWVIVGFVDLVKISELVVEGALLTGYGSGILRETVELGIYCWAAVFAVGLLTVNYD